MTPQEFSSKWADARLKERAGSQEHFLDVCRLVGSPTPADVDKTGEFFTFERGVVRGGAAQGGGKGFADVWLRGHFAWEYKGPHKNLVDAYAQLQLYREDLENPPLSVVCDMDRFEVHTNFDRAASVVYSFTNEDVGSAGPEGREAMRVLTTLFSDPDSLRPGRTRRAITEEVASKFALVADGLRSRGEEPRRVAHFLTRLVFCLFAEDVGLLPEGLFGRLIDRSVRDPAGFQGRARELFRAMASGGEVGYEPIRHFNGGLFADDEALALEAEELRILAEAARLDWSSVEPAIFGTLFERSLGPRKRAQLGAQYTGPEDVLRVVGPVLVDPLRREWSKVREEVEGLMATEHPPAGAARTRSVNRVLGQAQKKIDAFASKLRRTRVLDPACGSGNFLYVSLNELLDLEKEVSVLASRAGLGSFFPEVGPDQLHGVEIDPYARELAEVSVWIGYLQWMKDNGFGSPPDPILGAMNNVLGMDAIMSYDEEDTSIEPDWPETDVIVGNPPFLGDKRMRAELGNGYVENLRALYRGRVAGGADLVCHWFEKARRHVEEGKAKRAGLIATNGIRFGANRRVLERVKASGDIFVAWSDLPWVQEDAAVRVSIVGFDDGSETEHTLDGEPVERINPDLTALVDVTGAHRLPENEGLCFLGVMKAGPFDIDEDRARAMLAAPNPNGKPNSDVIKRRVGGRDVTQGPQHSWIIDFGIEMSEREAAHYELPFEYVRANVKPLRDGNRRASMRQRWWRHGEARPGLRKAIRHLERCIITPEVAKHRLFARMDTRDLPDHTLHVIARDDDYFFGVLHSRPHELWSLSVGNFMGYGNDPRYNSSRTFKTYPFPWPPGEEPADDPRVTAVADAAEGLDRLRRNRLAAGAEAGDPISLTALYNRPPTWLADAHADLDQAVFACYGWEEDPDALPEQEMLERLLALNLARTEARQLAENS